MFAVTSSAFLPTGLGRAGAAAAASDAITPALHKIERAAIAASTHITYPASELLVLIEDHLRASGLHSSADMLAAEAGLGAKRVLAGNGLSFAWAREAEPLQFQQQPLTPASTIRSSMPAMAPHSGELCSLTPTRTKH